MSFQLKRRLFTVKEYYKMAEVGILKPSNNVELLNGEIIQMSPIKSFHAGIVNRLTKIFNLKSFEDYTVCPQNPIHLNPHSEPEPDITIANYRKDDYIKNHPIADEVLLLIEVSDSTLQKDRKIKLPIYAEANIPEYWIVNLVDEQIEVYRNPKGEKYSSKKIYKKGKTIKCSQLEFELKVSDIF